MNRNRLKRSAAAALLAACAITLPIGLASRATRAEPPAIAAPAPRPSSDPSSSPQPKDQNVIRGTIRTFLKNDRGDIDGLSLDGGVDVRFPPHLGPAVQEVAGVGDEVEVRAERVTRPRGETVLEARQIEREGRTVVVEAPRPPKGKPAPKGKPGNEAPMNAEGVVAELATNPHGDVDGLRLEDETEVKFPPHLGAELEALVRPGEKVRIEGRRHVTPKGDVHLHADRIEVVATGAAVERHPPQPAGPRGPRPEPPQAAPGGGKVEDLARSQAEILRELREIRRLLEKRPS